MNLALFVPLFGIVASVVGMLLPLVLPIWCTRLLLQLRRQQVALVEAVASLQAQLHQRGTD